MSGLPEGYDEERADAIVIGNLLNEIRRLKGKNNTMILTNAEGKFYRVNKEEAHELTDQEVADALAEAQADVAMLNKSTTASDLGTQSTVDQSSTPSI